MLVDEADEEASGKELCGCGRGKIWDTGLYSWPRIGEEGIMEAERSIALRSDEHGRI